MGSLPRKTATAQIPNTQPLNFLGSCSLVGIGEFNLSILWLIGVVRRGYLYRTVVVHDAFASTLQQGSRGAKTWGLDFL